MPLLPEEQKSIIDELLLANSPSKLQRCFNFFCCQSHTLKSEYDIGIKNFSENINLEHALRIDITNFKTLQKLIKKIYHLNDTRLEEHKPLIIVRVAGGGQQDLHGNQIEYSESFSLTPGIEGDIVIRLIGPEFKKIKWADKSNNTVWVDASIQVGELHQILEQQFNLVMETAPLIPYVTIGGCIPNSCHGTGKNAKAMAGYILSVEILKPDGELITINKTHPDFYNIVGSNLGVFGVITRVELQCIPAQKLKKITKKFNYFDLIQELNTHGIDGILNHTYLNIMWIPTFQPNETKADCDKNILVTMMEPVAKDTPNLNFPATGLQSRLGQELLIRLSSLGGGFSTPDFLGTFPDLIPSYMRFAVAQIEVGNAVEESIGNWVDQWHSQQSFPRDLADDDFLFTVKLNDISKLINFLQGVTHLLETYPNSIIDAIYIRFFKGFNGGLSPSKCGPDEFVVAFDVVSSEKIPAYIPFRKAFQEMSLKQFAAKPHPGKFLPQGINFAEMYGDNYQSFINSVVSWYPIAKNPFINHMMQTILQEKIVFSYQIPCLNKFPHYIPASVTPKPKSFYAPLITSFLGTTAEDKDLRVIAFRKLLLQIEQKHLAVNINPLNSNGLFSPKNNEIQPEEMKEEKINKIA